MIKVFLNRKLTIKEFVELYTLRNSKNRIRIGMSMGRRPGDLSGQKFGLLTAMYPTEHRDHRGSVLRHCVCECGNEIDVSAGALMDGNNRSCGCLKDKNRSRSHREDTFVDGTCVEVTEKRKKRRDNESGFRGVFLSEEQQPLPCGYRIQRETVLCRTF